MTVMSTLAISGLIGSVLASNFTSGAAPTPINMTDLATSEQSEVERRLQPPSAVWLEHRKMFGDESECGKLGHFDQTTEQECRDLCAVWKGCNAINYAQREKLCDLRDCDTGAAPKRLHNKYRAQWLSDWGSSLEPMSRYIGCYQNQHNARLSGHILKTWADCEELAMSEGKLTFGLECPQCTSNPGQAQCLVMDSEYLRMNKRPDSECDIETANGRLMGNGHRLAVYEMNHGFTRLGAGYCNSGYYAGWNANDATLAKCMDICNREPQCVAFALLKGRTCSRYNSAAGECTYRPNGRGDHVSYIKEGAATPTTAPTTIPSVMPTPAPFFNRLPSNGYTPLGDGYCAAGYYAGWDPRDATVSKCMTKCDSEPQCVAISVKVGHTCSRYNYRAGNCSYRPHGRNDHESYLKNNKGR